MGLTVVGVAQPVIYDATADFTPDLPNPNGVWAYGHTTDLGTALTSFASYSSDATAFGWSTNLSLGTPSVFKLTGPFVGGTSPGDLILHPGPAGEYAVIAFTAPAAGQYALNARFFVGDIGGTDATIILNGNTVSPVAYFPDTGVNPMITGSLTLAQGDQVRFAVGAPGSFLFGSTPLTVTLTYSPVPEPSASALLLGLSGIAVALLRRRCS